MYASPAQVKELKYFLRGWGEDRPTVEFIQLGLCASPPKIIVMVKTGQDEIAAPLSLHLSALEERLNLYFPKDRVSVVAQRQESTDVEEARRMSFTQVYARGSRLTAPSTPEGS